ncbi:unnamed protein product [Kluyveromyces dobzhanskii CBS 2104]|uniref:WGS project CCBQ000000000 data, contig 00010 n=1 Tax=Kluyveromyces dobzhanskii CBS 2104 TaxID=1427455 RepID=A0A0A8LCT6_9SACH|nr:unnamed protein product [Kluyveromyces dobzhanskii CBS 2104]
MVKFALPDLESDDDADLLGISTSKAGLSDDEAEEPPKPVKFKMKRNKLSPLMQEDTQDDVYTQLFQQPPGMRTRPSRNTVDILNLEDLEGSEEEPSNPTENAQNVRNRSKLDSESNITEKTYVKLLNKEDKDELRDLGITAQSKNYPELDDQLTMDASLQDERLALGDKEKKMMHVRKRREIEQLIQMHDDDSLGKSDILTQELQHLDKISGQKTVLLPKLQSKQKWQDMYEQLVEDVATKSTRKTLSSRRIDSLQQQLQDLSISKQELLAQITCTLQNATT